jgi:acetyl-CoA carboxylase biotin carboxyl carrier protein
MEIRAEMPGVVLEILASQGSPVATGEALLVLESMKMEIPVESPIDGRLVEMHVAVGDQIEENDLLATLE